METLQRPNPWLWSHNIRNIFNTTEPLKNGEGVKFNIIYVLIKIEEKIKTQWWAGLG